MTYTEHRVLKEELSDLLNALQKADELAKDYFCDAMPYNSDRTLAMYVQPSLDQIIELVGKRLDELKSIKVLPI